MSPNIYPLIKQKKKSSLCLRSTYYFLLFLRTYILVMVSISQYISILFSPAENILSYTVVREVIFEYKCMHVVFECKCIHL